MDRETLRKVQLEQLKMAVEVKRLCEKHDIKYFLDAGTLLGAVRHKGFIPWDDDLDMGMLREDYEKFCDIASKEMDQRFFLQTWHTDGEYGLPFAKVRMKGTVYIEGKSAPLQNNGIYIDIFPYDNVPQDEVKAVILKKKRIDICRRIMMKSHAKPWYDDGKINYKKRLGYILYQVRAIFNNRSALIEEYEKLVLSVTEGAHKYPQFTSIHEDHLKSEWFDNLEKMCFENDKFSCIGDYDGYLTTMYGDYMTLPPESERENRHQILAVKFID